MKNAILILVCGFFLLPTSAICAEGENLSETTSSKEGIETLLEGAFGAMSFAEDYVEPAKEYLRHEFQALKFQMRGLLNISSKTKTPRVVIDLPPYEKVEKPEKMPMTPSVEEQDEKIKPEAESSPIEETPEPESETAPPQGAADERTSDDHQPEQTTEPELKPETDPKSEQTKEPEKVSALEEQPPKPVKAFPPGKIKPTLPHEGKVASGDVVEVEEVRYVLPDAPKADPEPPVKNEWNAVVSLASSREVKRNVVDAVIEIDAAPVLPPRGKIDENLTLGETLSLGLELADDMDQCVSKLKGFLKFCVVNVKWPEQISKAFEISDSLYKGTQAVARFDNRMLTHAHALFTTRNMQAIVAFLESRFGPPLETLYRIVMPFEGRPMENPTFIWRRNETLDGVGGAITLEVRKFDDSRGAFPDMQHGLIRLYGKHSQPIFPRVSPREMMLVKFAVK